MFKKIFKIIKILRFAKFLDKKNISKELIIFDEGIKDLELNLLKNYKFFWIRTRYDKITRLYISPELIIIFLKNFIIYFFNKNIFLQEIYFLSLIETLNPKVVYNDNFSKESIVIFKTALLNSEGISIVSIGCPDIGLTT
jgi:hypothetical protein